MGVIIAIEVVLFLAIIVFGVYEYNKLYPSNNENVKTTPSTSSKTLSSTTSTSKQTTPSAPDYAKLMTNLPKNQMIQDLPEGKSLYLRVFSFSSGNRVWDKSFIVGKGTMKEGTLDSPEVTINIHSKYVNSISSSNLCDVMGNARKSGDLGFESSLDYMSLAWKYSSLMKYKSCFS